jgi:Zn-dependent M28 family amino/carboxypeptidase
MLRHESSSKISRVSRQPSSPRRARRDRTHDPAPRSPGQHSTAPGDARAAAFEPGFRRGLRTAAGEEPTAAEVPAMPTFGKVDRRRASQGALIA